ncbi:hypothetical protein [Ekhidna sp.]|jgi:hypothetical protein|uniref:hypothetical protein n=1 Tax=Ekhidna sp. TaxID=2608089 RepID=UPI0032EF0F15
MKQLSNLLAALVFASLVIFMSCGGGGGDDGPSDLEIAVDNLTISGGFSNPTTVQTDGGTADGDWSTFGITFTGSVDGGSYTVSNVPAGFEDVWANGTWTINDAATVITRTQGGVDTDIVASIGEGSLTLEFDVADPTARTSGIAGEWTFVFN